VRIFLVAALALVGATAQAAPVDLELGAGAAYSLEGAFSDTKLAEPTFVFRAGYPAASFFTPGLKALLIAGPNGLPVTGGFQGWAVMADARLHSRGFVQVEADPAVGVGQGLAIPCGCDAAHATSGGLAPYFQLTGGLRTGIIEGAWAALDVGGMLWTGLGAGGGSGFTPLGGGIHPTFLATLSIGMPLWFGHKDDD